MYQLHKFNEEIYRKLNKILDSYNKDQNSIINLAACISYPFSDVLKIQSFPLATLPTEGVVRKRFFPRCTSLDDIEIYSEELCLKLFNLNNSEYGVSIQPNSGTQANQIVYNAIIENNDYILSLSPRDGGHISHTYTGKGTVKYYHLDTKFDIDYEELKDLLIKYKPKLIIVGASSYAKEFDYKKIYDIVQSSNSKTLILADICHSVLYIMGNAHKNIFPFVDFATFTMDKCLRGPQGGVLIYRQNFKEMVENSIFPKTQGGPTQTILFAKCVCFINLLSININSYAQKVISNTELFIYFLNKYGIDIVYPKSTTHIILINLSNLKITGKDAELLLFKNKILVNRNQIPNDTLGPLTTSGIRIGTVGITNLEYTQEDIKKLAIIIANLLKYKIFDKDAYQFLLHKYHQNINISN